MPDFTCLPPQKKNERRGKILLAKTTGIVYKYSTRLNFSAMKHIALTVFAVACSALTASAIDATNARIWLSKKVKPEIIEVGNGMEKDKKVGETAAKKWQCVKIPVHVEGVLKGDDQRVYPHFVSELKLRISLAFAAETPDGKDADKPELLTKEVTYVEVPLNKHSNKKNAGENIMTAAVFISPANAYKIAPRDGVINKKLLAVAVEGTFNGSNCNHVPKRPAEDVATDVVFKESDAKRFATGWWKKKGNVSGAQLAAISETPFAASYADMGFSATSPMYGSAGTGSALASVVSGAESLIAPSATGEGESNMVSEEDASGESSGTDASAEGEDDDKGKGRKGKKSRRSSRR